MGQLQPGIMTVNVPFNQHAFLKTPFKHRHVKSFKDLQDRATQMRATSDQHQYMVRDVRYFIYVVAHIERRKVKPLLHAVEIGKYFGLALSIECAQGFIEEQ